MIVKQVDMVTQQLAERSELERVGGNQAAIARTYAALEELTQTTSHFVKRFELLRSRFQEEEVHQVLSGLSQVLVQLRQLYERFPEDNDQSKKLFELKNAVDETEKVAEGAWKRYALQQVEPHFNLYALVRNLPEVTDEARRLELGKRELDQAIHHMPRYDSDLNNFDQHIATFESTLGGLRGINPEIQAFLGKVQQQLATVDDLTPGVLAWCRENRRGSAFKIRLA